MKISQSSWKKYVEKLSKINKSAAEQVKQYIKSSGIDLTGDVSSLIGYCYGISTAYGEAAATLAAEMYDTVAYLEGANVAAAELADTATYPEVAKTVNGIIKNTGGSTDTIANGIGRLVKMAGTDTILMNAARDEDYFGAADYVEDMRGKRTKKGGGSHHKHSGAEVAWIPSGDSCPFCLMLASRGWQKQTEWAAGSHSEHIHANCDCTYAVRFRSTSAIEGYEENEYKEMFDQIPDRTWRGKRNALRRAQYEQEKDRINAQKRAAYARRKEQQSTE